MIRVRKMRAGDLGGLYGLLSDPETMRYLEPPFTKEETERFLHSAGLSDPPLILAAEDGQGRFAGYVIFHPYGEDAMEIGWVLGKEFRGRGYAKELTRLLAARAASEGRDAVLECVPEQEVTKHIAGSLGFSYEGRRDGLDIWRLKRNAP